MSVSSLPEEFRTIKELGRGLREVHGCVHVVGEKVEVVQGQVEAVKEQLDQAKAALGDQVAAALKATEELAEKVAAKDHADALKEAYRAGALEAIGKTVGAPLPPKPGEAAPAKTHRRIMGVKVWQFWTGVLGALAGAQLALKIIDGIPWASIWHAVLNAH